MKIEGCEDCPFCQINYPLSSIVCEWYPTDDREIARFTLGDGNAISDYLGGAAHPDWCPLPEAEE